MDFVSRLIQEGYSEEDIGEVLESLYILDKSGYGNVLMEDADYIDEGLKSWLLRNLAKLRKVNPKQAKKLEDVAKRGDDAADAASKVAKGSADDIAKATRKVDATAPPSASSRRPPNTNAETARRRQSARDRLKADKNKTPEVKPKTKPGIGGKLKAGALVAGGALAYNALTGGDPNASDSTSTTTTSTNQTPTEPKEQKPKEEKGPVSGNKFWWTKKMPSTLGYQQNPSVSSYRNIRSHNELEGNFINEAHATVINYLISNGHADTIEEANYIMNQMEFDHIEEIVNENI